MRRKPSTARDNAWIADQLDELAARLAVDDELHRARAYRRAAEVVRRLRRPIGEVWAESGESGLDELPGVGEHIARVIGELIDSGRTETLERLRKKIPIDVMALLAVDGVGPGTLRTLWQKLQIRTLDDLERALREERVRALPGFGAKREARLLDAVRIERRGRRLVDGKRAAAIARRLVDDLAREPSVVASSVAGSVRRGLTRVGDIDLVAASNDPAAAAAVLLDRTDVVHTYSRGPHRVSVRLESGVDVDLRTVPPESFGSALLYFTGSRAHTLALRRLALAQGYRLNEYGLFRGQQRIAGETEAEIYEALSLPYVPPEKRSGGAEIRDALRKAAMAGTESAS